VNAARLGAFAAFDRADSNECSLHLVERHFLGAPVVKPMIAPLVEVS
jgi:hypothetical protein